MKKIYSKPFIEQLRCEFEESACAAASGTEKFDPKDGTWNTLNFNF